MAGDSHQTRRAGAGPSARARSRNTLMGARAIRDSLLPRAFAVGALALGVAQGAQAESAYCDNLRNQIAQANDGSGARYQAAAGKLRGEYARLAARGQAMGCDRQQFLFFGEAPPPQCAPVNARLNALRGQIAGYERASADATGQRAALAARFDAECRNPHVIAARTPRPQNFFEELFGLAPPDETTGLREVPVDPDPEPNLEGALPDDRPRGGSMAICVRACDGGFFPVSYSARSANLDDLNALCKALCPNAEAKLYTQSQWKGLETAVSIDGEAYNDHPNALKFQKSYDPACGCKAPGQSWTEALAEAERIIAERHSKDQMVTAEQAEQMSRPIAPGDPRAKGRKSSPSPEPAAAPALAPEAGLRGSEPAATDAPDQPGTFREVTGPDGVRRRVRVVAPTL